MRARHDPFRATVSGLEEGRTDERRFQLHVLAGRRPPASSDSAVRTREEFRLFGAARNPHPLEGGIESHVYVQFACILMKVYERFGSAREVSPLALPQLRLA